MHTKSTQDSHTIHTNSYVAGTGMDVAANRVKYEEANPFASGSSLFIFD